MYIHQLKEWPGFKWDNDALSNKVSEVRFKQGLLLGKMGSLGFSFQNEAALKALTEEVIKSSEIEGELLDTAEVRSSIARRLGIDIHGLLPSSRYVDGVTEMMLDATLNYKSPLTDDRLFGWHSALFPSGRSGMHKIVTGKWRTNEKNDPMQVLSGALGRERVHFQAPDSALLGHEMAIFIKWFNTNFDSDPIIKAGIAHLWFVTIHPFDDGNGRIARAIADMQLARADDTPQRFYSMSAQIKLERNNYYDILEETQKGRLDITDWLQWFITCYGRALESTEITLKKILQKANFWANPLANSVNERQHLMLNKLMDGFEGKLTSSKWAKIVKCSQDTATRDIQNLIERKLLIKIDGGGRSTAYELK